MIDRAQIYSKLTTVFREVLDEDDIGLKPETTADDVDGWDSLSHIRLVLAVSKAFGINFSASEIGWRIRRTDSQEDVRSLVAHLANVSAPDLGSFVFLLGLCSSLGLKTGLRS